MKSASTVWFCLALALGLPQLAWALNSQSFVASGGSDSADCSRSAPCLTFQGAHDKTAAGGQISCVDAADYGPVTITKAISIVCDEHRGSIYVTYLTSSIQVLAGPGDAVLLSGLDLTWAGVSIGTGGVVVIQHCTITYANQGIVYGIFSPGIIPAAKLEVYDTRISGGASGIFIRSVEGAQTRRLTLSHVQLIDNTKGLYATRGFSISEPSVDIEIRDSFIRGSSAYGVLVSTGDTPSGRLAMEITNSQIISNGDGVYVTGPAAIVRVGSSVIANNSTYGLDGSSVQGVSGSALVSYGDNQIANNGSGPGVFTTGPQQ